MIIYYVTHFIVPAAENLCTAKCCPVYFFTQLENCEDFLIGTSPENIVPTADWQRIIKSKHVIPFPEKILLHEKQKLFANSEFVIWLADTGDCESNKKILGKYDRTTRTFKQTA